jgi:CYTH domain-containing protein
VGNPSAPEGKGEKYARPERERRWLLAEPPTISDAIWRVQITDHYFFGTRLRLRCSNSFAGRLPTVYKLTQKVAEGTGEPILVTNTYLSEAEYDLLRRLGGDVLQKTRYSIPPFGVDVFDAPLDGLVLAEAEFASDDELVAFEPPPIVHVEVTDDERFSGGRLARTTKEELRAYLDESGITPTGDPGRPWRATGGA